MSNHLLLTALNQARDIYEEAIQTVITVRDFTQVFDAYAQFEESMISAKMETTVELGPTEEGGFCLNSKQVLIDKSPHLRVNQLNINM